MNRTFRLAKLAFIPLGVAVFALAGHAQTNNRPTHPRPNMVPPTSTAPGNANALTSPAGLAPSRVSMPASAYATIPGKKTAAGEQFFIVASIDLQKSQLLLKYPTEVTLLAKATDQTK